MHTSPGHLRARRLRARPHLSLRGFARELSSALTHAEVSDIETGKRDSLSLPQIVEWADALGVSPSVVLKDLIADRPHLANGRPEKKRKASKLARRRGRVNTKSGRRGR